MQLRTELKYTQYVMNTHLHVVVIVDMRAILMVVDIEPPIFFMYIHIYMY